MWEVDNNWAIQNLAAPVEFFGQPMMLNIKSLVIIHIGIGLDASLPQSFIRIGLAHRDDHQFLPGALVLVLGTGLVIIGL